MFFMRIFGQYSRYSSQDEVAKLEPERSFKRPMRLTSIKGLISFVDKKEEEVKNSIKQKLSVKQLQSGHIFGQTMSPA